MSLVGCARRPRYTCPKPPLPSFLSTMYSGLPPTWTCESRRASGVDVGPARRWRLVPPAAAHSRPRSIGGPPLRSCALHTLAGCGEGRPKLQAAAGQVGGPAASCGWAGRRRRAAAQGGPPAPLARPHLVGDGGLRRLILLLGSLRVFWRPACLACHRCASWARPGPVACCRTPRGGAGAVPRAERAAGARRSRVARQQLPARSCCWDCWECGWGAGRAGEGAQHEHRRHGEARVLPAASSPPLHALVRLPERSHWQARLFCSPPSHSQFFSPLRACSALPRATRAQWRRPRQAAAP